MKKKLIPTIVISGLIALGAIGSDSGQRQQQTTYDAITSPAAIEIKAKDVPQKTCDGTKVIADCIYEGVSYASYTYTPAVPEKSHSEITTTYEDELSDYCTLCNDGSYSPSCATGRGACSHHGGVGQWNAPRYHRVPVSTTKTVIDTPAQAEQLIKVVK